MQTIPCEETVARKFRLQRAPTLLAQQKAVAPIAFTRLRSDGAFRGRTMAAPPEEAFSFQVALAPMPAGEIWLDGKHGTLPPASPGDTFIFDLAERPIATLNPPYDFLRFYLPVATLDQLAYDRGLRRAGRMRTTSLGARDPVLQGLALSDVVHGSGTGRSIDPVRRFDCAGLSCPCCADLRRFSRKRKLCRDGARALAASARPCFHRCASRRRSVGRRPGAGMWPVCQPFRSRLSAGRRHAAPSMADEETDRTREGVAAERRQSPRADCPRLRLRRPEPSHAHLHATRRLWSGKMAPASWRLIRPMEGVGPVFAHRNDRLMQFATASSKAQRGPSGLLPIPTCQIPKARPVVGRCITPTRRNQQ